MYLQFVLVKLSCNRVFQLFNACFFRFQIGKFLIKMQHKALPFYLGLKNEPSFGPAGSEKACNFHSVLKLSLSLTFC